MSTNDPLRNELDPLRRSGPDQALELFRAFSKVAHGFSAEDVISAATNILVNGIRQSYDRRPGAEARYDELFGRTKSMLLSHYDSVTGRRKSVFPFNQEIRMEHFRDKSGL